MPGKRWLISTILLVQLVAGQNLVAATLPAPKLPADADKRHPDDLWLFRLRGTVKSRISVKTAMNGRSLRKEQRFDRNGMFTLYNLYHDSIQRRMIKRTNTERKHDRYIYSYEVKVFRSNGTHKETNKVKKVWSRVTSTGGWSMDHKLIDGNSGSTLTHIKEYYDNKWRRQTRVVSQFSGNRLKEYTFKYDNQGRLVHRSMVMKRLKTGKLVGSVKVRYSWFGGSKIEATEGCLTKNNRCRRFETKSEFQSVDSHGNPVKVRISGGRYNMVVNEKLTWVYY